jgi:hypothetical protein
MDKNIQSLFNKLKRRVLKNRKKFELRTFLQDFFYIIYKGLSSARLPLIVFGFVTLLVVLFFFVKYLSISPLGLDYDSGVEGTVLKTYDSNINTIFVVMDDRESGYKFINTMDIVLVDNVSRKVTSISIDPDLIVKLNKENIPIRNLYNFLDGSSVQRVDNLIASMSDYLAIRIDRYFLVNLSDLEIMETNAGFSGSSLPSYINYFKNPINYLKSIINFDTYRVAFRTNLNRVEYTSMINAFGNFDITTGSIDESEGVVEGDNIVPDFNKVDSSLYLLLRNIDLLKEQIRIEIYNATSIQGAANKVARSLEVYGVDVIKTGNYPEELEETSIYVAGNKNTMIANYTELERLFRGELEELKEYKYNYSGDIILIIGNNFQD